MLVCLRAGIYHDRICACTFFRGAIGNVTYKAAQKRPGPGICPNSRSTHTKHQTQQGDDYRSTELHTHSLTRDTVISIAIAITPRPQDDGGAHGRPVRLLGGLLLHLIEGEAHDRPGLLKGLLGLQKSTK